MRAPIEKEQILASAPRDLSRPPTGAASTDVDHQDLRLDGKGGHPVRFSAQPCIVTRLSHSISHGVLSPEERGIL